MQLGALSCGQKLQTSVDTNSINIHGWIILLNRLIPTGELENAAKGTQVAPGAATSTNRQIPVFNDLH